MTLSSLVIVLALAALGLGYGVLLTVLIRNDGRLTLGSDRRPPRSHAADLFEPPHAWL